MKKKNCFILSVVLLLLITAILVFVFSKPQKGSFDLTTFDVDNIYSKIETITDEPYSGRLTGSIENKKLLEYVEAEFKTLGIKPAGANDTYYQPFSTLIADIDTEPLFVIPANSNKTAKELLLYVDYNLITSMNGGGIDFSGDLLFAGNNLFSTDADSIKGKVLIIEADELSSMQIDYVIECGGKGVFCCADYENEGRLKRFEQQKYLGVSDKTGGSVAAGYISIETYEYLRTYLNDINTSDDNTNNIISNVRIKAEINYPIVETANILGKIEGKSGNGKVLIISANIDGAGRGTEGEYFEGALRNASGIATLLEAARVISRQDSLPYQTIVFVGFNGQEQDFAGSKFYVSNPVFPLADTTLVHLEAVGAETTNGLLVSSDKSDEMVLRDAIMASSEKSGLLVSRSVAGLCAITAFAEKGINTAMLSDVNITRNTYEDKIGLIDKNYLRNASLVLLYYIKAEYYPVSEMSSLSAWEKFVSVISSPIVLIKNIFNSGTDTITSIGENHQVILNSVFNSLKLIITSLILSISVGMTSGLYSGYKSKKKSIRSLGSLIGFSIPDVLIILLGWRISTYYGMFLPKLEGVMPISSFIMPLITISILPAIYISRITFITVQEEIRKEYLRNSKAKGFSRKRIIFSELLPAAMLKIVDTLPAIMTMLIGNLIVVECLYNYLGAAYYLIYFYGKKAYYEVFVLILALGIIYSVFSWFIQLIAKSTNPTKYEVMK